jgi:hypothetical protein
VDRALANFTATRAFVESVGGWDAAAKTLEGLQEEPESEARRSTG